MVNVKRMRPKNAELWTAMLKMKCLAALITSAYPLAALSQELGGTSQNHTIYEYLDKIEREVGSDKFDSVPYDHAFSLAESLEPIDLWNLDSASFISHLQYVQTQRTRFYAGKPLTGDDVKIDLASYRIRYELTPHPGWMMKLGAAMYPVTKNANTADQAAKAIFRWMSSHIKMLNPSIFYPIPNQGDLDPLSVLKGGYGTELDQAIFGVAALRVSGVAGRFVWAPTLRGEVGGKAWLEYLGENGNWNPWVPSFGIASDHHAELGKRVGQKIVVVLTRPAMPVEITETYVETMVLDLTGVGQDAQICILIQGKEKLSPCYGPDLTRNSIEHFVKIGRGPFIVAASYANTSFSLLPIEPKPATHQVNISAQGNTLTYDEY